MLRLRLLVLLAGCLFLASATLADDIGYVDCSSHPEGSQIYGKARQSTDIVGSVPCGERFIVLLYGFIFSRIQTADNKVGYVLSSLISVDHSVAVLQRPVPRPAPAVTAAAPAPQPATTASVQTDTMPVQPASAQPATAQVQQASAQATQAPPEVTLQSAPAPSTAAQPASAQPASTQMTASANSQPTTPAATPVASSTLPQSAAMVTQPASVPASSSQPVAATTSAASAASPDLAPRAPETSAPASQPAPQPVAAQPEPLPPQPSASQPADPQPRPVVEPIRNPTTRASWESRVPGARKPTLVELFGGFAFSRFDTGSGSTSNLMGGLGSFGVNVRSWLQIVGDTSYNFVTTNGTKYVLFGNHYGPRYYYRGRRLFRFTPFAEALIGGSRLDTTISGSTSSANCISYKIGGGLDVRPTRRLEIRVLNFDYYRTSFGTNAHQTNYWASAGIILRLFGTPGE